MIKQLNGVFINYSNVGIIMGAVNQVTKQLIILPQNFSDPYIAHDDAVLHFFLAGYCRPVSVKYYFGIVFQLV